MERQPNEAPIKTNERIRDPSRGSNQSRVRAHNERLVLSLVRRHGSMPKAEIARRTGLSPQTVSVIMRALEKDALLVRGEPQRGRVGQPSIPMALNPDAVFSIGLKIGRRSAELILMDFVGGVRLRLRQPYAYPLPDTIMAFVETGLKQIQEDLGEKVRSRIVGIGIATPFELWNWYEQVGAPAEEMNAWRTFSFADALGQITDLPVIVQNDATSACGAELVFGRGSEFTDFAYFFVGYFIGGGLVLNNAIYPGRTGSAGAFGPLPVPGPSGRPQQLLNRASIFVLENRLREAGIDPSPLWLSPDDWPDYGTFLSDWIDETARNLAIAIVAVASVIDMEAAVIDGGFPASVRSRLVERIQVELRHLDLQGVAVPAIIEGSVGDEARAIGGASLPLFDRFMVDQNVLIKERIEPQ
ncbi:MAG: ROK family transcriptional regulator [Pseudomonadota bacterium]